MFELSDVSKIVSTLSVQPSGKTYISAEDRRVILALLAAAIPNRGNILQADDVTLNRTLENLDHSAGGLGALWVQCARMFDLLAIRHTGRRFSNLPSDRQDAVLLRWERDPVWAPPLLAFITAAKLVHFDRDDVYQALGGKRNVVTNLENHAWLQKITPGDEAPEELECEIVVVGTGAGGAVVGRELADKGRAVLFVEEGDHHRRDAFTGSSMRAHRDFYRGGLSVGNNVFPVFMGKLVGGSTAVNGGTSFRTPDWVLQRWCDRMGTSDFTPASLEPYFERVENTLQIEPADARFIGNIQNVIRRGCEAFGWSHFVINRNAPGCEGTGFCDFGCRTDARRSTNLSYIPPALERGAELITGLRAESIIVEGGRATGVECTTTQGRKRVVVRAESVIFAGGAMPTPFFLARQGICNSSGHLGKNLTLHPSAGLSAVFDEEMRGFDKIPQGYGCDEFLKDGLLMTAAQPDWNYAGMIVPVGGSRLTRFVSELPQTASFGILAADDGSGRTLVDAYGTQTALYNLTRSDVDRLHRGIARMGDICLAAGARRLLPSLIGAAPIDTARDWERFKKEKLSAKDLMLTSYHPLGTARMSPNPRDGVVDLNHETHDVKNLFLVDGSTIEGPLGVNPQLTIMAMATRAAERIDRRLS